MMKVMLITGASRGIGAATAMLAARNSYAVAVNYINHEVAAEKVAAAIRNHGGKAIVIQADVSKQVDVERMFTELEHRLGKPDVLVNNAGTLETQRPCLEIDEQRMQRVFASNVMGPFLCAQEAARRMSPSQGGKGGAIVNVSSIAALTGAPFEYVDYAASKAALDAMTKGMAKEWASENIRVNAVRPAFIYTDIHAAGGEPQRIDNRKHLIPMKRGGKPGEVAAAILWLASEEASYITGAFINVSGGLNGS